MKATLRFNAVSKKVPLKRKCSRDKCYLLIHEDTDTHVAYGPIKPFDVTMRWCSTRCYNIDRQDDPNFYGDEHEE